MTITPKETAALRLDLAHRGWGTHVISHFEDDDDYSNLNIRISKTFRDLPTSNIETTSPYNKIGETFIILNEYVKIFENNPTFIPNIELTPTKKISPVREPSDFEIDFNNLNDEYQLADLMRQKGWRYSDREMVHGTNLVKYRRISFDRWTWHGAITEVVLFDLINVTEPTLPFAIQLAKKALKAYTDFPTSIPKVLANEEIVEDVLATERNKSMKHKIS